MFILNSFALALPHVLPNQALQPQPVGGPPGHYHGLLLAQGEGGVLVGGQGQVQGVLGEGGQVVQPLEHQHVGAQFVQELFHINLGGGS